MSLYDWDDPQQERLRERVRAGELRHVDLSPSPFRNRSRRRADANPRTLGDQP